MKPEVSSLQNRVIIDLSDIDSDEELSIELLGRSSISSSASSNQRRRNIGYGFVDGNDADSEYELSSTRKSESIKYRKGNPKKRIITSV